MSEQLRYSAISLEIGWRLLNGRLKFNHGKINMILRGGIKIDGLSKVNFIHVKIAISG